MEIFSALLIICARNSPVTGEFPAQRPVTRSLDVFFDLRLNKRLSTQWRVRWFETPSRPLWRHCNDGGSMADPYRGIIFFLPITHYFCAWINGWVNNGESGDLRRHRAHYDVTVMMVAAWRILIGGLFSSCPLLFTSDLRRTKYVLIVINIHTF